jgi:predicted O-methyltransferase YrrM
LKDFEDESLDFIFIDGDHRFDAIMMDIICWVPKIRKNGIIIIHDYYATGFYGVRQAVDAYTQCHNINPWFTTKEFEPTAFWVKS